MHLQKDSVPPVAISPPKNPEIRPVKFLSSKYFPNFSRAKDLRYGRSYNQAC